MAINIRPYIIINGRDSRLIEGLIITALPKITKPKMRVIAEEIDGRNGDIVTELGYSAYDKSFSIGLHGQYDVDLITKYLNTSGKITFSNEPDKYYLFALYNQIDYEKLIRYKTAEVYIHCQPFKFALSEMEKTFTFSDVESGIFQIRNNGNVYSKPTIKVTGSGEIALSINNGQVLTMDLEADQTVIIDPVEMNAYALDGSLLNRKVYGDYDLIRLAVGQNSVSFTGEVTSISIEKYSRWI